MIKVTKFGEVWLNGFWVIEENLEMGQFKKNTKNAPPPPPFPNRVKKNRIFSKWADFRKVDW